MSGYPASPLRAALVAQVLGALFAFSLFWLGRAFVEPSLFAAAVVQGLCAAFVSWKSGAPRWWWPINLAFMPLAVIALALNIAPGWYLLAFVVTLLLFWRTDRSRVPLYLSNNTTADAVAQLLPEQACAFVDLGCGDGRLLARLADSRPDARYTGIEHAPLPWLLARLRHLRRPNVTIRYGNFWRLNLADFDVAYAFLSPAPMSALNDKVEAEMKPGKLLISNSFPIPGRTSEQVIEVNDRRQSQLFCYKTGLKSPAKPRN